LQIQEKQKKKKSSQDAISKWRKARESGEEFPVSLLEDESPKEKKKQETNPKKRKLEEQNGRKFSKRQMKDNIYGFGGKKKGSKSNTSESFANTGHFSIKKDKKLDKDMKTKLQKSKGIKPKKKKIIRPGKKKKANTKILR